MEDVLLAACRKLHFGAGIAANAKKIKAKTHLDFLLKLLRPKLKNVSGNAATPISRLLNSISPRRLKNTPSKISSSHRHWRQMTLLMRPSCRAAKTLSCMAMSAWARRT